jgi:hypothetical protein
MPIGSNVKSNIKNKENPMSKIIIKVTLNSQHPAEAELIKILESVKNRSANLKMAAFHYWNIIGRLGQENNPQFKEQLNTVKNSNNKGNEVNSLRRDVDFSNMFG